MSSLLKKMDGATTAAAIEKDTSRPPTFVKIDEPYLEWALGGGFFRGRLNVIAGPSGSGKSFLAILAAGKLQRAIPDSIIIIKDIEHYFNMPERVARLRKFGIDLDRVAIFPSSKVDEVFGTLQTIEDSLKAGEGKIAAIIVDSLGGLQDPHALKKIADGDIGDAGNKFGGMAKVIGTLSKFLNDLAAKYDVTIFLIQHAIEDMDFQKTGNKWIITGGQKLRFQAECMLLTETVNRKETQVDSTGNIIESKERDALVATGKTVRVKVVKSRGTMEGKVAEIMADFDTCKIIRQDKSLFSLATKLGTIYHPVSSETGKANVQWWAFTVDGKEQKYHGEEKTLKALREDVDAYNSVVAACMANPNGYTPDDDVIDMELGG